MINILMSVANSIYFIDIFVFLVNSIYFIPVFLIIKKIYNTSIKVFSLVNKENSILMIICKKKKNEMFLFFVSLICFCFVYDNYLLLEDSLKHKGNSNIKVYKLLFLSILLMINLIVDKIKLNKIN